MAHPQTAEAVDAPVDDMDSAAAAIDRLMGGDDNPRDEDQPEQGDEDQSQDEDDLDLSDDEDGEHDEPEAPAIDAPASLTAEEKAAFAALPKEAQKYVTDLEARRAVQVQTATTKASEAQRTAEAAAARADAVAQAKYAQQLKAFGDSVAPQRPDPALAQYDPQAYIAQQAQYEAAKAQHDDFMQQVQSLGTDAETTMSEVEIQQRDRELMNIPEVQNEGTREQFFSKAIEAGKMLGLDMNQIGHATAGELKALRQVAEWQEDSAAYRAAKSRQMQRVRDGKKTRTTTPNAAQPRSSESRAYRDAKQHAARTGDVKDAARAIAALG